MLREDKINVSWSDLLYVYCCFCIVVVVVVFRICMMILVCLVLSM